MSEAPRYVLTLDHPERPGVVEFWSEARMPFEPKDGVKDMRVALRSAVRRLSVQRDELLHATYASPAADFCDAENILFYNVGTGNFSSASRNGIRFQRAMVVPPPPATLEWRPNHYHRYEVGRRSSDWLSGRKLGFLVGWRDAVMPRLSESTSASVVWWAMPPTNAGNARTMTSFGIELDIRVPVGTAVNPCAIAKPLLDGAIAACHAHDGTQLTEISARLASQLNQQPDRISERLMSKTNAILGTRRLLHLRGVGVQWNPADDLCVAASIAIISGDTPANSWSVSGELFEVAPP